MNKTIITGRLVRDPEMKTSQSGIAVTNFSVAVDRPMSKEKAVDYFDCVAFRKTAEFVQKYFMKGKPIMIEGHMQSRKWEKDGVKRTSWELVVDNVEFFGGEKKQNGVAPAEAYAPAAGDGNPFTDEPPFDMNDEELNALPL